MYAISVPIGAHAAATTRPPAACRQATPPSDRRRTTRSGPTPRATLSATGESSAAEYRRPVIRRPGEASHNLPPPYAANPPDPGGNGPFGIGGAWCDPPTD